MNAGQTSREFFEEHQAAERGARALVRQRAHETLAAQAAKKAAKKAKKAGKKLTKLNKQLKKLEAKAAKKAAKAEGAVAGDEAAAIAKEIEALSAMVDPAQTQATGTVIDEVKPELGVTSGIPEGELTSKTELTAGPDGELNAHITIDHTLTKETPAEPVTALGSALINAANRKAGKRQ